MDARPDERVIQMAQALDGVIKELGVCKTMVEQLRDALQAVEPFLDSHSDISEGGGPNTAMRLLEWVHTAMAATEGGKS